MVLWPRYQPPGAFLPWADRPRLPQANSSSYRYVIARCLVLRCRSKQIDATNMLQFDARSTRVTPRILAFRSFYSHDTRTYTLMSPAPRETTYYYSNSYLVGRCDAPIRLASDDGCVVAFAQADAKGGRLRGVDTARR